MNRRSIFLVLLTVLFSALHPTFTCAQLLEVVVPLNDDDDLPEVFLNGTNETVNVSMSDEYEEPLEEEVDNSTIVTTATSSPTASPSTASRVLMVGFVTLELVDTHSTMNDKQQALFEEITEAFVSFNVFLGSPHFTLPGSNQTYFMPLVKEKGVTVIMDSQSRSSLMHYDYRRLQQNIGLHASSSPSSTLQPLYVTLKVHGVAKVPSENVIPPTVGTTEHGNETDMDPIPLSSLDDFDFDAILQQIFIDKQVEYVEALQISEDLFFSNIHQVTVVLESTVGELQDVTEPPTPPIDINKDTIADMDTPDVIPTAAVQTSSDSDKNPSFDPVIIGIAIGGAVLLLVTVFCVWYCWYSRSRKQNHLLDGGTKPASGLAASERKLNTSKNKAWNRICNNSGGMDGPVDSMAEQNLMTDNSSNKPDEETSDFASDADVESQAMYSYNPGGDSGSAYTSSNAILKSAGGEGVELNPNHSFYGNDNISYAYSLEPGIEASILDGVMANSNTTTTYEDSVRSRVPIREIPQITVSVKPGGKKSASSGMTKTSLGECHTHSDHVTTKDDGFGEKNIEICASDLQFTPSELAMIPSTLISGEGDDGKEDMTIGNDTDSKGFPMTKKGTLQTILAPSGKLGIVIDTTVEGPVVHSVNQGSRLKDKIFPSDIIVAIDDVDTRAMSASAITALMIKTAAQTRKLTVRRFGPT